MPDGEPLDLICPVAARPSSPWRDRSADIDRVKGGAPLTLRLVAVKKPPKLPPRRAAKHAGGATRGRQISTKTLVAAIGLILVTSLSVRNSPPQTCWLSIGCDGVSNSPSNA